MKAIITALAFVVTGSSLIASSQKFSRDRAAILAMAGAFEVEFNFKEIVLLAEGCALGKSYQSNARELVKVAEDAGDCITLQHLLVIEDEDGPAVIKHWAQIWKYEGHTTFRFEGDKTWLPVTHSAEEAAGT